MRDQGRPEREGRQDRLGTLLPRVGTPRLGGQANEALKTAEEDLRVLHGAYHQVLGGLGEWFVYFSCFSSLSLYSNVGKLFFLNDDTIISID